jgi:diguanylate cyclase (GGDEF)-like protein
MATARAIPIPKLHESPRPLIVLFLREFREQREAIFDLVVLALLSLGSFILLHAANFTEAFYEFTRQHEDIQLDETLIVTMVVLATFVPIFALRRWHESTRRLREANTDMLTGMFNRRMGWRSLEQEVVRSERYERPLSICLFDIDKFKSINDEHGHLAGDRILKEVAVSAQARMRGTDTLVRWGGEEFLIICPETDRLGARGLAERLRKELAGLDLPQSIQLTASFGTAEWRSGDDIEGFYRRVDDALYEAKAAGRNRVV